VNRIEAADITPFVFQKPPDFDLSTYLADSFGIFGGSDDITVVVKFWPAAARYVLESDWQAFVVANGRAVRAVARRRAGWRHWLASFGNQ
jgi:WYL domain